jgi:putative acetyltransferase
MTAPTIAREPPRQPELGALMADNDALYAALYPAELVFTLDVGELEQPEVAFYVARVDGRAVGYGAIVGRGADWAEIKRMYVDPAARGRGLGKLILDSLEAHARRVGVRVLRLETGNRQPAAIGLYRAAGYVERGAFGDYPADPTCVFMEKTL